MMQYINALKNSAVKGTVSQISDMGSDSFRKYRKNIQTEINSKLIFVDSHKKNISQPKSKL